MKILNKLALITISIILIFNNSCKKEEEISKESLLTSKIWRYKKLTYTTAEFYSFTNCYNDSTSFKTNGEYICGRCDGLSIGNWKWTEFEKKFELEQNIGGELHKASYTILTMNDTILEIREENENSSGYSEYKYSGQLLSFNEWLEYSSSQFFPE